MQLCKYIFTLFLLFGTLLSSSQKTVDLSYQNLRNLPSKLKNNQELEELILTGNPLKSLPEWITEIKSLRKVILNEVSTLNISKSFEILSSCDQLAHLSWENGKLVYLPSSISKFPKLKILKVKSNGIVKLPLIKSSLGITQLDLSNNLIDSLGPSILYLKQLQQLNLSNNPGVNNENNYHLLENIPTLKTLITSGITEFPVKLCQLKQLKCLDVSNSKFNAFPEELKKLNSLNTLNIYQCKGIDFPQTIEKLSQLTQLKRLVIGGTEIKRIPFNVFKISTLKELKIRNSCLTYFPTSLSRLNINTLILENCSLNKDSKFFENASQIKSLKKLGMSDLVCRAFKLEAFARLDSLDLTNCQLTTLPTSLKNISWINLQGNYVPQTITKIFTGELIKDHEYSEVSYNKRIKHKASLVTQTPFRKTIYTQIGESFTIKGVHVEIPPNAFIDKESKVIEGEVIVSVNVLDKPHQLAMLDKKFSDSKKNIINPIKIIELKAYRQTKNDSLTKEEVYINQKKAISLSLDSDRQNSIKAYCFSPQKKSWNPLSLKMELCKQEQMVLSTKSFKSKVFSKLKDFPTPSFTVRNSKVQIRLKRNKRRNTLKFEIIPEYGYKENFFQLFGDRIKGYPELKVFKKVKWNYVGDSVEQVLKQLYFLSEQAKSEKLKRKSNFYFYVLDIKNITIKPNETADNYIMSIVQGKDTLSFEVLPILHGMKAKKVQKWHEKKYKKYQKSLQERILYWLELDSLHLNHYTSFEKKLRKFRLKVIDNDFTVEKVNTQKSDKKHQMVITANKAGTYQFAAPLRLKNVTLTPIKLKISGRNHHAKYVLVRNPKNEHAYWQETKAVSLDKKSENFIYSKSGNQLYVGKYDGNKTINLIKFESQ